MVQVLVRYLALLTFIMLLPSVSAATFTEDSTPEFIFAQGTNASVIFTCLDGQDFFCNSGYECNITVISPNSSIFVDNQPTTRQSNYYNYSLPNTNTLGIHSYNLMCTNQTNSGAATELSYLVNLTGEELTISKTLIYLFILVVTVMITFAALLGAVKIPWKDDRDEDGFIVTINDLKYVKIILWFFTYIMLMFITWLTGSLARFLEMGIASNFFTSLYFWLLVFAFPIFIIIFLVGLSRFLTDRKLDEMMGRNIKVR